MRRRRATGSRGHVVSSLDGHALARATVVIAETQGGKVVQTVRAGEDGAFVITGVAAGKYSMEGSATGYLTSAYDAHEQFSTAIVTGAGLPTEDLVLRLPPAATISGRVTDESGEPVRGAAVSLFMETHGEGTSRITRLRYQTTDDLGEYEMAALRPGNYFVAATATPWYAVRPQMTNGGGGRYHQSGDGDRSCAECGIPDDVLPGRDGLGRSDAHTGEGWGPRVGGSAHDAAAVAASDGAHVGRSAEPVDAAGGEAGV